MGELALEPGDGGDGVASAYHGRGAALPGLDQRLGDGPRALVEGRGFEHPHRAVPEDRLGFDDACPEVVARGHIDVEDGAVRGNTVGRRLAPLGRARQTRRYHPTPRQDELRSRLGEQSLGDVFLVALDERPADRKPDGEEERARHRPSHQNLVHLGEQRVDDVDLSRDLGAAQHRDERALGMVERVAQVGELALHEEARDGGLEQPGDRFGGGVGAMRRAEGVVDVEVAQRGERLGEPGVVRLFAGPEPGVLDEGHAAARQPARGGDPRGGIGDEFDRRSQDALHVPHDLLEGELGIGSAGASQVRQQHHPPALVAQVRNRGDRGADPRVVADRAALQGHVEIHAHQRPPAVQRRRGEIAQTALAHFPAM